MVENNTFYNELYNKYHTINKHQNGKSSIEAASEVQVRVKNTAKSNKKDNKYNQDSWKNEGGDPISVIHHSKDEGHIAKPKINNKSSSRRNSKFEHVVALNENKEKELKEDPFGKLLLLNNNKQPSQITASTQKNGLFHNRTKEKSSTKIIATKTDQEYFNIDLSKGSRRKSAFVSGNLENRLGAENPSKKSFNQGVNKHPTDFDQVSEQAEHEEEINTSNLDKKISSHLLKPTSFQVKQSKIIVEDDEKDHFSHQSAANNNEVSLIKEKFKENEDQESYVSDIYNNDQHMSNGKNQPDDHQAKVSQFIDSSFDSQKSLKSHQRSKINQKLSMQRSAPNLKDVNDNEPNKPKIVTLKSSGGPAITEGKSQLNTIKITTDKDYAGEKLTKGIGGIMGPITYDKNNARSPKQSTQNGKKKFLGCLNLCY